MVTWTQASTGVSVKDMIPQLGFKQILVRIPATFVGGTDTITIDLSLYGCTNVVGTLVFRETTAGSVTGLNAVHAGTGSETGWTTAVASGVLTVAPILPPTTCIYNIIIWAY